MIFGKKDNLRVETVLNDGVEVDGDIRVREGIYINTRIKGNITSMPNMEVMAVISVNASITGNVHIPKIYVHGTIKGDVHASNYIELSASSCVLGDIYYRSIKIREGATINGQLYHIETQERGILEHLVNPAPSRDQLSLTNQRNRAKPAYQTRSAPQVRSNKLPNKNATVVARAGKKK